MNVAASLVDLSSLSTGGALFIAGAAGFADTRKLFNQLLAWGLAMSIVALFVWGDSGFADLDYRETLRLVVPASTMLILGVQTVLASFFISILGITGGAGRG